MFVTSPQSTPTYENQENKFKIALMVHPRWKNLPDCDLAWKSHATNVRRNALQ